MTQIMRAATLTTIEIMSNVQRARQAAGILTAEPIAREAGDDTTADQHDQDEDGGDCGAD